MTYWNKDIETLDRKGLETLQLDRLQRALHAAAATPFYRSRFADHNIYPDAITSLERLRDLPFTTKNDLRLSYPDGMLAVPREEVVRLHASSGTTGKSTVIFYTGDDVSQWADIVARGMYSAGISKPDTFQNMMGYGLFTGGLGLHYGAEKLGCLVIPSSTGNSLKQLQRFRISTRLWCTLPRATHCIWRRLSNRRASIRPICR
jgi:phenylacetate-CoA ligase